MLISWLVYNVKSCIHYKMQYKKGTYYFGQTVGLDITLLCFIITIPACTMIFLLASKLPTKGCLEYIVSRRRVGGRLIIIV